MPVMRYQIRNEYGLADPELYLAAERDDPEAILEGVAMAGLVGVLRQLGDLAEFAAEIFHELHEEVMATAARGHGLMLRVQQLEAEFPSIEKAFLLQTNHSHFGYNAGVHWHTNPRIDQNLITRGDMPRFILDSYEECRGPPRLFMLDKFDVAGAGASLKRYSDPSFFKRELASSGAMESELQREKKARKVKKKLPRWRNDEVDISLAPHAKSNFQLENIDQASEKNPTRRVRLKTRHLNGVDTSSRRSYMESLLEVHSPEEKVLLEDSRNQPKKSIHLRELAPEVHEIVIDESDKFPSPRERNHTRPSTNQITPPPANVIEKQKTISEEFFETLPEPFNKVEIVEKKELPFYSKRKTKGSIDSHRSSEAEKNDDIGSEMENYVDALNTMDSEIETDSEVRAIESQRILYDTNKELVELVGQYPEPDSIEESTAALGFDNILNKGMPSLSELDNITLTELSLQDIIGFDEPGKYEEARNNALEELQGNAGAIEDESSVCFLSDGPENIWPAIGEASSGSRLADSTSTLTHLYSQENFNDEKSITPGLTELSSCYVKSDHRVAEPLDDNIPCMAKTFVATKLDENNAEKIGMPYTVSQKEDVGISEQYSQGHVEDLLLLEKEESRKQDTETCSSGSSSPTSSAIHPEFSSLLVQPDDLSIETKGLVQPNDFDAKISPESEKVNREVSQKFDGSSIGGDFSEISHPTENEELEDIAEKPDMFDHRLQEQKILVLENSPVGGYGEDQPLCLEVSIGEREASIEQDTETCLGETTSIATPAGIDAETDCSDASGDELERSGPAEGGENADDIINVEIPFSKILPLEMEFSTDEELHDDHDVGQGKEAFPDGEVAGLTQPVTDNLGSPSRSTVSSLHQDALEIDRSIQFDESSGHSPEASPFDVNLQEDSVHSNADPNQQTMPHQHAETIRNPAIDEDSENSEGFQPYSLESVKEGAPSCTEPAMPDDEGELRVASDFECESVQSVEQDNTQNTLVKEDASSCTEPAMPDDEGEPRVASDFECESVQSVEQDNTQNNLVECGNEPSESESEQESNATATDGNTCELDVPASSTGVPWQLDLEASVLSQSSSLHTEISLDPNASTLTEGLPLFTELSSDAVPGLRLQEAREVPELPPLPPLEWRMGKLRLSSLVSDGSSEKVPVQPLRLSELPPIVEAKGYQNADEREMVYPLNPSSLVSPLEDGRNVYSHNALWGEMLQPSNPFAPVNLPEKKPLDDTRPQLSQLIPALELERCRHGESSMGPYLDHFGVVEGEDVQHLRFSAVLPATVAQMPQQRFVSSGGEHTYIPDDSILPAMEDVKPNGKFPSIRNLPRHPLIDAVAAHDKTKLRKVSELVQSSTKPKAVERDTLLEQIRNKTFNLKPTSGAKPNIQGPQTNLKVAAILEKASAIRQACAGSDEDEDSWSDS